MCYEGKKIFSAQLPLKFANKRGLNSIPSYVVKEIVTVPLCEGLKPERFSTILNHVYLYVLNI